MKYSTFFGILIISYIYVFVKIRNLFYWDIEKHNNERYVESDLKLIRITKNTNIYDNGISNCIIKDNENFQEYVLGDIISGYYKYENPTICISKIKMMKINEENYYIDILGSWVFGFLFTSIIFLIIGVLIQFIVDFYGKEIDNFFYPYDNKIKHLEEDIKKIQKKLEENHLLTK